MAAATLHACRKHRINQVFARPEAECIDRAIRTAIHPVMSEATLLMKHRLLEETSALGAAGRNVAPLVLDVDDVERAISAVVGKIQVRTSRGLADGQVDAMRERRLAEGRAWEASYARMRDKTFRAVDPEMPLSARFDEFSVRRILGGQARKYVAEVLTNVRYHYTSYVTRSINRLFRARAASVEGVPKFEDLSKRVRMAWNRLFRTGHDDLLSFREGEAMQVDNRLRDVVDRCRPMLVPSRLPDGARTVDQDLCSADRCFVYLGYMVRMVGAMQAAGERNLPSPLPLKTSFIPSHYSIDTGSLCQLIIGHPDSKKTIKKFANYYEHSVRGGCALPGLRRKDDLCSSLQKLSNSTEPTTAEDEQRFMDAIWTYLGRFNRRKAMLLSPLFRITRMKLSREGKVLKLFDHSISTDGYSVSLTVTGDAVRGRHNFKPTFRNKPRKGADKTKRSKEQAYDEDGVPVDSSTGLPILTSETAAYWTERFQGDLKVSQKTGGDPGKCVILQMTGTVNGVRKNLRYTAKQRKFEADGGKRAQRLWRARHKRLDELPPPVYDGAVIDPRIKSIEQRFLRTCSPRSATLPAFREYVRKRDAVRPHLERLYAQTVFRWGRFVAWVKRDISVERFAKKITETYGRDGNPVVIFYGDWGRRPNLKNQAPTPGIGLRRLLHASERILTITVRESYTSSFCPCCSSEVDNARGAHGLLKCASGRDQCGMYWSRDVLGASNILAKANYLMQHPGTPHPLFMG